MVEKEGLKLTKNQALVMSVLKAEGAPLSAYAILDALKDRGLRAPLQIYRATDKLLELGLVHRLESLNAFVACSHPKCHEHELSAFMICTDCGKVEELSGEDLSGHLATLCGNSRFALETANIELRGSCEDCT